ncbi:MAG: hypothetical protein GY718_12650 [Lentisphaerae bacterium]|nr:hypothetical protein [Lentisphaerota bacterium]
MENLRKKTSIIVLAATVVLMTLQYTVSAHCNTENGPVLLDAKLALKNNDVTPVLKWIPENKEKEIIKAFSETVKVSELSPEAKDLATKYFFNAVVRIHLESEGKNFTGIKPDNVVPPIIKNADNAISGKGDIDKIISSLQTDIRNGIKNKYDAVRKAYKTKDSNVKNGREYVKAYVSYIHCILNIYKAVKK